MRYIGLLAVVAIIYITYSKMVAPTEPTPAQKEDAALVKPLDAANPDHPAAAATPAPHTDQLKAPLDRTREVLDQVKKQNSGGQF